MTTPPGRDADEPTRWRVLVHALDRTGPPVLVRSFVRWLHAVHPDDRIEVLAFRGGPVLDDLEPLATVRIVLDHHEPWDHLHPDPDRFQVLKDRLADLEPVAVNLLVSTSAGQVLPLLGDQLGPIVTWSVEMGPDQHWLQGDPISLRRRTDVWLAGSATTAAELAELLEQPAPPVVPEFVEPPAAPSAAAVAEVRAHLGIASGVPLVVGAGIGTARKGMDLFVEVAAAVAARTTGVRFAWIGGESDPLYPLVADEIDRWQLEGVSIHQSVPDLDPWLQAATVFLHTAREDAFPLVCLHAALAGLPVVAFSGTGGVTEMFGEAFVGDPFPDVVALADRVVALTAAGSGPVLAADTAARQYARIADRHVAPAAAACVHDAVLAGIRAGAGA